MGDNESNKGFTVTDRRSASAEAAEVDGASDAKAAEGPGHGEAREGLPHIDFTTFVMSLASSALIHLGELAAPGSHGDAGRQNLALAKQTIDILGMLEDKTRGNLSDEEARLLQHLLYDLRLKFVEARRK